MKRRTSRWLSILLALCLALALLPGTAWAKGKDDIAYPVTGGNIYFDPATGTVTDADYTITAAVIPREIGGVPVTTIGEHVFNLHTNLTSVTIPDSVTTIGLSAFRNCIGLTNVTIPDSVTTIGGGAFSVCTGLTSVTIPDSVTSIGDEAFADCTRLTSVEIPGGVTSIETGTFNRCYGLTSVTIPDSVTSIGGMAFWACDSLTSVTIPGSVTSIGSGAFGYCTRLTSVTIPDSVTSIGEGAFEQCASLRDIYYAGSLSQWEQIKINNDYNLNLFLLATPVHFNSVGPASSAPAAEVAVTVNGNTVKWTDVAPFIDANDRTMVPLRAVADAMDLTVNWDAAAREAAFTGSGKTITFPIDSSTARTSDGGTVTMDTAAVIVNDRTYAPIRYLAEYFGYTVGWDAATRTVTITG